MSTEMTQVPGAAAAQNPANQQPQAAQPTAGQPTAEQPKNDSPAATPANPTAGQSATPAAQPAQAPTLSAPTEPAPVAETSWLEDETMGLSNRTWCEIVGGITVAAAAYFVGQYVAGKSDDAPASV